MPAQPVIRQAEAQDSNAVALLVSRLLDELTDGQSAAGGLEIEPVARELLQKGLIMAWLAIDGDGCPVGLLTINECAAIYAGGRFGEITELYVDPGHRSSGLGERLIETARDLALTKGWGRLEVGAPDLPRWRQTVEFYQRQGFLLVGPRLKLLLEQS